MKPTRPINILFLLLAYSLQARAQDLINYPVPENVELAPEFKLEVNGQEVFVYNTRPAAFVYFSFTGSADVVVTYQGSIYNYEVRPKSKSVEANLDRKRISFLLDRPAHLSVEINKNIKRPLFIFADAPETEAPKKEDKNVIFYEAGKVHYPGEVILKSDQTVYIEGGAVVRGHFLANKAKNVRIMGHGVLDNSEYLKGVHRPIEINQCENVRIEGIILTESRHWSCGSFASKNVTYDNFKIISDNDWDDGIDIVGSQDVTVDNCFIRTKDDCIAVKAGVNYFTDFDSGSNVDDIIVQNSIFWNGVWGNALEIGFETRADTIKNVTFRNCDIIHAEGPEGTFTIHNGDRAVVKNVLYENIRVEDARGWLIDFRILQSRYSKDTQRGRIQNVRFKNIHVEGEQFPYSQLLGFSDDHNIQDVILEDFYIHEVKVTSIYNGMIATNHVDGLAFE